MIFTGSHGELEGKDVMAFKPGEPPVALIATKANEMGGSVSPDGEWLAYSSDVSGKEEVYVKALAGTGPAVQISHTGAMAPLWSPMGGELFYRVRDEMWSCPLAGGKVGMPRKLFSGAYTLPGPWNRRYSVTADGKRFLMIRDEPETEDFRRIHVVENWTAELGRMIPGGR